MPPPQPIAHLHLTLDRRRRRRLWRLVHPWTAGLDLVLSGVCLGLLAAALATQVVEMALVAAAAGLVLVGLRELRCAWATRGLAAPQTVVHRLYDDGLVLTAPGWPQGLLITWRELAPSRVWGSSVAFRAGPWVVLVEREEVAPATAWDVLVSRLDEARQAARSARRRRRPPRGAAPLAPYAALARHWDKAGAPTLWHRAQLLETLGVLPEQATGGWIDLGCGTGRLLAWHHERFAWCLGIDLSDDMIAVAKGRRPAAIAFRCGCMETVSVDAPAALLTCFGDALNYLDPEGLVRAMARIRAALAPDGVAVVDWLEPRQALRTNRYAAGPDVVVATRVERGALRSWVDTPDGWEEHTRRGITAAELDAAARAAGLAVKWEVSTGWAGGHSFATLRWADPGTAPTAGAHPGPQPAGGADLG